MSQQNARKPRPSGEVFIESSLWTGGYTLAGPATCVHLLITIGIFRQPLLAEM